MQKAIDIINGPNLNLLGQREPEIYGSAAFEDFIKELSDKHPQVKLSYFQSNIEGELINYLQESKADGIILNAAGYAHTSIALADTVAAINTPVINVHISNIYAREKERHQELLAKYCQGGIYGLGLAGYEFALQYLLNLLPK